MQDIYASFGISRQAHHQALAREKYLADRSILYTGLMCEIRQMHPNMGLRKMYEQFQPEGIGRDAFISLGLSEGFRLKVHMNPMVTTRGSKRTCYPNLLTGKRFTDVNQVWVSDLFYFAIEGKHHYVVLIMDAYSRRIIGFNAADNMRAENNIRALQNALTLRGIKNYEGQLIHHSDRGSQYIFHGYLDLLDAHGIQVSMCTDVLENAHMERANGIIKNDYLKHRNINSLKQLQYWLRKDVDAYNHRIHENLIHPTRKHFRKMTPIEFENYVKELPKEKKPVLEIFTINNQISENPNQLTLF
ncbi:MAG: DDE-type integrase/transposase/recombinase [Bacteroidota bacterium]